VSHLIDGFIDLGVLLDIGIGGGNISFGLIIIIITDKKFDSILRKEFFKFTVQLGGQGRSPLRGPGVEHLPEHPRSIIRWPEAGRLWVETRRPI
jgi:hypothetical protein